MAFMDVHYKSGTLGMDVTVSVILPQKAEGQSGMEGKGSGGKFRVLWLLHGAAGDQTSWERRTSIERYAAGEDLAVVMPAAHLSGYSNMAHGYPFYDYIVKELPCVMRDFFPLSARREDNYIAGLSMGGAGAMKIGLANPENYSVIGCLSAGAQNRRANADASRNRQAILRYGTDDPEAIRGTVEDPLFQAGEILRLHKPVPRIYHAIGDQDFLWDAAQETRTFFEGLAGNPFDYVFEHGPGVHSWEFWDTYIQHFLAYLKKGEK